MNKKREEVMGALKIAQIPSKSQTIVAQGHVEKPLYSAVVGEAKRRNIKIRQVVEWGFRTFLLSTNPKMAKELGIVPEKE